MSATFHHFLTVAIAIAIIKECVVLILKVELKTSFNKIGDMEEGEMSDKGDGVSSYPMEVLYV